jgi:hypothetical protein
MQRSETHLDNSGLESYDILGKPPNEFSWVRIELDEPWREGKFGLHQGLYREWYKIIGEYTTRDLSRPADKIPALSGLARNFAQHTTDRYVAGLWERDFGSGLLWIGVGKRCVYDEFDVKYGPKYERPRKWRAPSWSWASLDGETAYRDSSNGGKYENAESMLQDVKIHAQMSKVNKFGHVISGGATLTGLVKEVTISIGSHSTRNVQRKAYSEAEIMRSIETGISLVLTRTKSPTNRAIYTMAITPRCTTSTKETSLHKPH